MPQSLLAASSKLSDLPDRLVRLQALTALGLGRVPILERLPIAARARLAQFAAAVLLLTIGTLVGSALVWAFLAVPLVAIVMLILIELEERRRRAAREPRDYVGVSWVARPVDDTPIVVRRGARQDARRRERRRAEHATR